MTSTVHIRPAQTGDHATLVEFNQGLARETEGRELDPRTLAQGVRAALDDPARGWYRVAELDGCVVGCLLVTREWSDWRNGWIWWIQSVFVAASARRRGVYAALHRQVLAEARSLPDVVGLRLYVDRDNSAAQATYRRLGMAPSHYLMFEARSFDQC